MAGIDFAVTNQFERAGESAKTDSMNNRHGWTMAPQLTVRSARWWGSGDAGRSSTPQSGAARLSEGPVCGEC